MKYLLLLLYLIAKVYSINKNIIVLPMNKGIFAHIKIKDSFLNFYSRIFEYHIWNEYTLKFDRYIFEVDRNITNDILYQNNTSKIYFVNITKKINIFKFCVIPQEEYMKVISNILNNLGYIDNKFYLEDKEKNHLYFGGIPQNITKKYNLFSLEEHTDIDFKMEVKFNNGTINETIFKRSNISFNTQKNYIICFSRPIFSFLKKLIAQIDNEYYNKTYFHDENNIEKVKRHNIGLSKDFLNIYNFENKMKNFFPNLTMTIGNKILNLNKYNIFKDHDDIYTDLLISSSPCDTIRFGKYFFELFDYSEYDTNTKIAKMYLEKNNSVFKEIEENLVNNKYIKTSKIDILILCSIIFMVTLFDIIIINKSKNIKYFNNYYEINN